MPDLEQMLNSAFSAGENEDKNFDEFISNKSPEKKIEPKAYQPPIQKPKEIVVPKVEHKEVVVPTVTTQPKDVITVELISKIISIHNYLLSIDGTKKTALSKLLGLENASMEELILAKLEDRLDTKVIEEIQSLKYMDRADRAFTLVAMSDESIEKIGDTIVSVFNMPYISLQQLNKIGYSKAVENYINQIRQEDIEALLN